MLQLRTADGKPGRPSFFGPRINRRGRLRQGRQCGSGAHQVGAYPDGLAKFGFGLRLVFESQVSKADEVMGVGSAGAGRGLFQLILPESYKTSE